MSFKSILLVLFIIACGVFITLKMFALGNPNSNFNQTTRLSLGKYPIMRTILGLHSYGDARVQYLYGQGPIEIRWYRAQLEDINGQIVNKFANYVTKYTGRPTKVVFSGVIDDAVTHKNTDLRGNQLFAITPGTTTLSVYFAKDYTPRGESELSTTYEESGILLSMESHRHFLSGYDNKLDDYLLSSMLHEFGHQLGLEHNNDSSCIMAAHAGTDGSPLEVNFQSTPTDFCVMEQTQIRQMKLKFSN